MKKKNIPNLRAFSLGFLLPGLVGLIVATSLSTHYLNTLPRYPDPDTLRMTPRNIDGYVVYQTDQEDRALDLVEYSSIAAFVIGLGSGLIYLQKWGLVRAIEAEDDEFMREES